MTPSWQIRPQSLFNTPQASDFDLIPSEVRVGQRRATKDDIEAHMRNQKGNLRSRSEINASMRAANLAVAPQRIDEQ
ncbi:hypothetical protein ED28_03195 [[Pantoea] beijingensis]|uniref:Uncharacterized protein n=1 Tax=[Pantoea] beijingensis TaxID=1324864 RepID=A0A443IGX0_9GAMM|nr:hypothetical protein ED28_03195 [[Pantoea] beijingensis]